MSLKRLHQKPSSREQRVQLAVASLNKVAACPTIPRDKSVQVRRLFTRFEDARLFIRLVRRNNILHKSVINSVESVVPRAAPLVVQTHARGPRTHVANTCV